MTDPDLLDDTAADHERLETELLAQDRDAARVSTADVDETMSLWERTKRLFRE